jgi:hypothetical protein
MNYQAIRNMLGKFGLPGDKAVQKIETLSGGQKARVVFVEMGLKRCHILLLDEPTNHLDLETVRAAGPGADVAGLSPVGPGADVGRGGPSPLAYVARASRGSGADVVYTCCRSTVSPRR